MVRRVLNVMKLLPEFAHLAKTPSRKLTTKEVAAATGVPYSTVVSWITTRMHRLKAEKVEYPRGPSYEITVRDLLAYEPMPAGRNWRGRRKVDPVSTKKVKLARVRARSPAAAKRSVSSSKKKRSRPKTKAN